MGGHAMGDQPSASTPRRVANASVSRGGVWSRRLDCLRTARRGWTWAEGSRRGWTGKLVFGEGWVRPGREQPGVEARLWKRCPLTRTCLRALGALGRPTAWSVGWTTRIPSPQPSPIRWERVPDLSAVALRAKAEGRVRGGCSPSHGPGSKVAGTPDFASLGVHR